MPIASPNSQYNLKPDDAQFFLTFNIVARMRVGGTAKHL